MKMIIFNCLIFLLSILSVDSLANVTPADCLNYQVERLSYEEEQDYAVPEFEIDQEGKLSSINENLPYKEESNLYRLYEGSPVQKCNQLSNVDKLTLKLGRDFLNCPDVDNAKCESFKAFIASQNDLIVKEAELFQVSIQDIKIGLSKLETQIVKTEFAQKINERHKEIFKANTEDDAVIDDLFDSPKWIKSVERVTEINENKIENIAKPIKSASFENWILGLWSQLLSLAISLFNFFTLNWG